MPKWTWQDMGNTLRRALVGTNARSTSYGDECPTIGGNSTDHTPQHYFAASIAF